MKVTRLTTLGSDADVATVAYEPDKLVISVESRGDLKTITFSSVIGFRVLDEGDLLEYWPACSSSEAGLYHIHEGGWLEQESARQGFLSASTRPALKEFFLTGHDDCVNVLALDLPVVT